MKTNSYLLPNRFKKVGQLMILPFMVVCLWLLLGPGECEYCNMPVFALFSDGYNLKSDFLTFTTTDPINEAAMIGLLVSIVFVALSKEKDEDEMIAYERQSAFVLSFWITAVLYATGIIFVYGLAFLYYTFAMPYIFFIIYIMRFNLRMFKLRRS